LVIGEGEGVVGAAGWAAVEGGVVAVAAGEETKAVGVALGEGEGSEEQADRK
jgi:hypothetical protein